MGAQVLRASLDLGMKIDDTARTLHVHANTLRHRLRRFEEATGAELRDPRVVVELWWALAAPAPPNLNTMCKERPFGWRFLNSDQGAIMGFKF